MNIFKRISWHYDAIKNGGASINDCEEVELNLTKADKEGITISIVVLTIVLIATLVIL
jgi:hypothetical protein